VDSLLTLLFPPSARTIPRKQLGLLRPRDDL
jgi:hypothetical protein